MAPAYQKLQSAVFMLPEKGVLSAVVWTVHGWRLDCAAGPEESSTGEVPRLFAISAGILESQEREPNQIISDLEGYLSCKRWEAYIRPSKVLSAILEAEDKVWSVVDWTVVVYDWVSVASQEG